jgi:hypothetical protein
MVWQALYNLAAMQVDGTVLHKAIKEVANRHAIWDAYRDFCLCVAKWTTIPLLDSENHSTLDMVAVHSTVDDFTTRTFQLSKTNKVRVNDWDCLDISCIV